MIRSRRSQKSAKKLTKHATELDDLQKLEYEASVAVGISEKAEPGSQEATDSAAKAKELSEQRKTLLSKKKLSPDQDIEKMAGETWEKVQALTDEYHDWVRIRDLGGYPKFYHSHPAVKFQVMHPDDGCLYGTSQLQYMSKDSRTGAQGPVANATMAIGDYVRALASCRRDEDLNKYVGFAPSIAIAKRNGLCARVVSMPDETYKKLQVPTWVGSVDTWRLAVNWRQLILSWNAAFPEDRMAFSDKGSNTAGAIAKPPPAARAVRSPGNIVKADGTTVKAQVQVGKAEKPPTPAPAQSKSAPKVSPPDAKGYQTVLPKGASFAEVLSSPPPWAKAAPQKKQLSDEDQLALLLHRLLAAGKMPQLAGYDLVPKASVPVPKAPSNLFAEPPAEHIALPPRSPKEKKRRNSAPEPVVAEVTDGDTPPSEAGSVVEHLWGDAPSEYDELDPFDEGAAPTSVPSGTKAEKRKAKKAKAKAKKEAAKAAEPDADPEPIPGPSSSKKAEAKAKAKAPAEKAAPSKKVSEKEVCPRCRFEVNNLFSHLQKCKVLKRPRDLDTEGHPVKGVPSGARYGLTKPQIAAIRAAIGLTPAGTKVEHYRATPPWALKIFALYGKACLKALPGLTDERLRSEYITAHPNGKTQGWTDVARALNEQWTELRARFPKTKLTSKGQNGAEKAFYAAFMPIRQRADALVKRFSASKKPLEGIPSFGSVIAAKPEKAGGKKVGKGPGKAPAEDAAAPPSKEPTGQIEMLFGMMERFAKVMKAFK